MKLIALISFLLALRCSAKTSHPEFYAFIGKEFFEDNMDNEASGIDMAPDGSHLVVASDDGKIFFLNLLITILDIA